MKRRRRNRKAALLQSMIIVMLCAAMVVGSTYAWFTSSVSSNDNIIKSGKLDIDLLWNKDLTGSWTDTAKENAEAIFNNNMWEPGYTDVRYFKIRNNGDLAFKYALQIVPNGTVTALADVIDVYYVENPTAAIGSRRDLANITPAGTLSNIINGTASATGVLLPKGETKEGFYSEELILAVALKMQESAGNEYQGMSIGDSFNVILHAVQYNYEEDDFGNDYDGGVALPGFDFPDNTFNETVTVNVEVENNQVKNAVTLSQSGVSVTIPAGVKVNDGITALTLTVVDKSQSDSNVTLSEYEVLRPMDVHVEGVSADNTIPMPITLEEAAAVGLNTGNLKLYHVENGSTAAMQLIGADDDFNAHNQFKYDPATGSVVLYMATFSEVAVVADSENAWKGTIADAFAGGDGTEDDPYIIANADQLVYMGDLISNDNENYGDKYYKLIADVNFGGEENANKGTIFYPIGYHKAGGEIAALDSDDAPEAHYIIEEDTKEPESPAADEGSNIWYTYGGSFKGNFDGAGHKISNIYQNTWQMKGNYSGNYWNAAMGLFGYVNGGTVKNLTVDNFSSDGEFTPTGVIAAYAANSTFENIAITNCNPRVYNTGNGGIVGIGGNSDDPDSYKLTFTNITIDNTNKISALWGSWDVACGGLVGMFRGDGHVYMTNCHVAAQIDVYNDVCGNYQYYWYRYSGMMVGTNKNMTTDANGYTVPETDKFHAENCTVHFGEWNDYYYCELVANSLASYTHDHQFSRLEEISSINEIKSGDSWIKAGNFLLINGDTKTCYHIVSKNGTLTQHLHTDAGEETVNGETVLKEDKQIVYLPFNQLFTGYGWGVKHIPLGEFGGVTILDREVADSVEKFETKFTGDFLYRVGNQNTVSLGSLFVAKNGVTINNSGVVASIDNISGNATGDFTANTSDWTKGTIQFSGTGVVKVTIQDYDYCTPTVLELEVIDATNATDATSATKNNVVLLNDCGFSSLEVSGGYTLYGNGFTMTCGSDSVASDMGYGFVTLNNGTLDNVQIVCPNFDYAALYKSNLTSSDNRSETDNNGKTRYYNAKSGVMASGNSQILNSRISGGRAAVNVTGGNVVIDNSRVEGGAVASVLVGAANSLTLRDVTLVQKPTASTYDSSKNLMGFSVLYLCDSEGKATPTTLEGSFVQQAWVNADDKQYVPSAGQDIVDGVMKETAFIHNINGKDSLNLGFAYMPEDAQKTVAAPDNITDNRTDKATIPYEMKDVKVQIAILSTTVYVYSYKNTSGTADSFKTESEYVPNKYSDIITVNYSDTADGLAAGKSYGTDGWVYELNVDLDKLSGYALDFSKLSMSVNGVTVTDFKVNGNAKPTSPVAVTAGGTTYTLTATVNGKEYSATYKVTGTETSKESPSLVASNYEEGLCVASSYGGTWHGAAPALEGIQIKYWSVAEKQYKTINLSDYTPTTAGKLNGTNTTWTYSPDNEDFTLTLTGGQVHSGNSVNAMPVVCDGKLYFVAASSKGLVNSGNSARTIPVSYSFKDNNNGDVLTFSHTWSVAENKDAQYNYSDFCNGTLTQLKAGSSSGCVTPDTLITLADGSQVRVDSLDGSENLLVWNMETGMLDSAPIMFVDSDPEAEFEIVHLYFSDGSDVKVIYEHGFWDYDLNRYVYLDRDAADYIGHSFAKQNGDSLSKVTLSDVVIEKQLTTAYSPVTSGHLCYFVNGMLSMPGGVGGLFNIFDVDPASMTYDLEAMARDIEKYGLFSYEELNAIAPLSEEMFNAAGGAYLKVSIGKGNLTMDELIAMINRYSVFF